jgi:hypothetical protein
MLIRIMYRDGRFDMVKSFFIDWLIESGRIAMFRRSEGWVVLGRDPVRHPVRKEFHSGVERREEVQPPLIALLALRVRGEIKKDIKKEPKESARWESDRSRIGANVHKLDEGRGKIN